jgi:hypothetical protein
MLKDSLLVVAIAIFSVSAAHGAASIPTAGSNWQRVEALQVGTSVEMKFKARRHLLCSVKTVTDDSFTCVHDIGFGSRDESFTKAEIKSIKIAHRARSGVYGSLIGGGVGAAAGGVLATQNHTYSGFPPAYALIYGFVGLISGAPVGYLTDFTASTVYRAN